jgi:hypothetical protein
MSQSHETVDVLMPTYNSVKYLDSALRCIEKEIPNCRLIVVDHHSNDGTLEVLKRHGANIYFDDTSLGRARQLLFEKSNSRILIMFDSDVVIEEEGWYQRAVQLLNSSSEGGKRIGAVALLPAVNPPFELEKFKRFWWRLLPSLQREFFVTHSTLFLRESVKGIQIPQQLGAAEDVYIWLHIRKGGYISRTMEVRGTHYFTLSEKKGRWMGANLRILQSLVGVEALQFVLRNVLLYPFLALIAATFTWDSHVLYYNIRRWFAYVVGYFFPARYRLINRDRMADEKQSSDHTFERPGTRPTNVAIVIVNWNGKGLLHRCLTSLKFTNYAPFEVLVVDNGSTDGSVEMIREEFPWTHLLANNSNLGYPSALNQGIMWAIQRGADYVFVANNDIEFIHSYWLDRLVILACANPDFGIIGPALLSLDGKVTQSCWLFREPFSWVALATAQPDMVIEADYVQGAAFLIRKEVVQQIGVFDEGYYPTGIFEDTDYCVRAKMAGYRIIYYSGASVLHVGGASFSKLSDLSTTKMVYSNLMRFRLLWFKAKDLIPSLMEMWLMTFFRRVDSTRPLGLRNLALQRLPGVHLYCLARAFAANLRQLPVILHRRLHNSIYLRPPDPRRVAGFESYRRPAID